MALGVDCGGTGSAGIKLCTKEEVTCMNSLFDDLKQGLEEAIDL